MLTALPKVVKLGRVLSNLEVSPSDHTGLLKSKSVCVFYSMLYLVWGHTGTEPSGKILLANLELNFSSRFRNTPIKNRSYKLFPPKCFV